MIRRLLLPVLGVVLLAACGDDDAAGVAEAMVSLDGSPRIADDAGRLVDIAEDFSSITLDGDREYAVDPRLQSFSALDGSIQPLLKWQNQYVQVGLAGDTVQWIGGVAAIVEVPGQDAAVYYTDVLAEQDGRRLVFRSGAVFDAAAGVAPPSEPPVPVVATIDVATDQVVALEPG